MFHLLYIRKGRGHGWLSLSFPEEKHRPYGTYSGKGIIHINCNIKNALCQVFCVTICQICPITCKDTLNRISYTFKVLTQFVELTPARFGQRHRVELTASVLPSLHLATDNGLLLQHRIHQNLYHRC